jgi:tripartite-type tricarboxylate transporter receptor subunit TctC
MAERQSSCGITMKLVRRRFLHLAASAAALLAVSRIALALDYPARPVRIIDGFPPGGASDIVARLTAQWLSQRLHQQFIVENRPGASSNIAAEEVVQAPADGYTLLLVTATNAINATLYDHLSFNFIRDVAPVAGIVRVPNVMVINPSVPADTVPAFIAYAKANPGKINMASGGVGTPVHVAGELFKAMAGVNLVHVPYHGDAPALVDLVGGQVQVMFDLLSASIAFIRSGKLRALAVTTATRSQALPNVPTIAEFLPGYEASSWEALGAPRGTPSEIVGRLNKEINAGFADPTFTARLADFGGVPLAGSPADFGKFMAAETEKWGKVIKFAGIKAD